MTAQSLGAVRLTIVYEIPPGSDASYLLASPHMIASSWSDALATRTVPKNWHEDDGAIDQFAQVLKDKMRSNREKGRTTWRDPAYSAGEISRHLREHVDKGDPRDVAIYCMFLLAKAARIEPLEGPSADDMRAELQVLREIAEGFVALGAKSDLEDPAYISETFATFEAAEADARASGYLLTAVEAVKKPSALPHCLPLHDSYVDHQLEIVLRAAGSALRHYAEGTQAGMRCAMRSAMGVVDSQPAADDDQGAWPAGGPWIAPELLDQPWTRANDRTMTLLYLCGGHSVPASAVAAWSDAECQAAEDWAMREHLHASDNDDVERVPMPACVAAHPYVPGAEPADLWSR